MVKSVLGWCCVLPGTRNSHSYALQSKLDGLQFCTIFEVRIFSKCVLELEIKSTPIFFLVKLGLLSFGEISWSKWSRLVLNIIYHLLVTYTSCVQNHFTSYWFHCQSILTRSQSSMNGLSIFWIMYSPQKRQSAAKIVSISFLIWSRVSKMPFIAPKSTCWLFGTAIVDVLIDCNLCFSCDSLRVSSKPASL